MKLFGRTTQYRKLDSLQNSCLQTSRFPFLLFKCPKKPSYHSDRKYPPAVCGAAPQCLITIQSQYHNNVAVYDMPDTPDLPVELRNTRVLLLDESGNLHSIYRQGQPLTGAYWDGLAVLPAFAPEGDIAILGLAAGTIAHLIATYYQGRKMQGWELDPAVVEVARKHMGLQQLEQKGLLVVHTGDALSVDATVGAAGAAGIIVDLFADGQLIPQLTQVAPWCSIRQRLAQGGRVMANLGAALEPGSTGRQLPGAATTRQALAAMAEAFEGELTCCNLVHGPSANLLVVSGPPISQLQWQSVPQDLKRFADTALSWQPLSMLLGGQ